jgi:hypothetical protein
MDADLTLNSIVFKKSFDEKDGSERRSIARGVNTPDVMTIKHQDYVDSKTKVPGRRHLVRVDREDVDTAGTKYVSSCYLVLNVPSIENQTDLDVLVATFKAVAAWATTWAAIENNET